MRQTILLALLWLLPSIAAAQERAWVQIEAHPSLVEAQARARDYARRLPDVSGFALGGPWYGVTLGPYTPEEADATIRRLRADGIIPRDSYVSDGETYGDRFWPVGLGGVAAAPSAPVAAPAAPLAVDETPAEARRSEATLGRDEKMALQQALEWLGFYDAAIDGSFGAGTRASMAAWQASVGAQATGVLTTSQRAELLAAYDEAQSALGLAPLTVPEAGIALTAPLGLVAFERIEAPFVHYGPRDDSGVRLSLLSQAGDASTLAGLYEIIQTLDIVPEAGERERGPDGFRITGVASDRTTEVRARLEGGHVTGFVLSWPEAQDALVARILPEMERTLTSTGPALARDAGFEATAQDIDMVSGLEVRRPLRAASGFWVDRTGAALTAAANVEGCRRVTLDDRFEADVAMTRDGAALLRPAEALAPLEVASLAPAEGRLRSPVSVSGFPFGGVLTVATLNGGVLEDIRGLDGRDDVLRLSLAAEAGEAGGPLLDPAGRVTGMLLPASDDGLRALPGDVAFALKGTRVAGLLRDAGIELPPAEGDAPLPAEALAARAAGLTVLVSCWE